MTHSLSIFERRARYGMGGLAVLMLLALVLFKSGLVSTSPAYKEQAWYSISDHSGFMITKEYADEVECRSSEKAPSTTCRSGKSLIAMAAVQDG